MGISARKTNGGFIGVDTRPNVTGSVGVISQRKHRLSRFDGKLVPDIPTAVIFEDDFSTGNFTGATGGTWVVLNENNTDKQWIVGQDTDNSSGVSQTIPSGSSFAAFRCCFPLAFPRPSRPLSPSLSRHRSGVQRFSVVFRVFEMVFRSFQQFSASDLVFRGFEVTYMWFT